jgi:hypothetical protein
MTPQEFMTKWGPGGPAFGLNEQQGAQTHFLDLCDVLGVPKPGSEAGYVFEKQSLVLGEARGYADVFKSGVFAWENKAPGKNLDAALRQLLSYALALSNPPILVVCDRLTIRVHTQFTGYPTETFTVLLAEMDRPESLALLRRIWLNPESFRPAKTSRAITEDAAESFATLAEGLRKRGPDKTKDPVKAQLHADTVAHFLTQCLFCFFAEDVELLPGRMFDRLVNNGKLTSAELTTGLGNLFRAMRDGGLYGNDSIPWFNGGLFKKVEIPLLTIMETAVLRNAALLDWRAIDVSIFGTLFERGLDPAKRSQLGAHYTDPATIMRIVEPVLERPLLEKWSGVSREIGELLTKSKRKGDAKFRAAQVEFVQWLKLLEDYRVLDPACGSGNFLFMGLKALKDIELKTHLEAHELGLDRASDLVTGPKNMLGIELNEYAAELARVTVWIGELQWRMLHGYEFKKDPVLEPLDNIECRDALMALNRHEDVFIEADWPTASIVIGNPPFLGGKKFMSELGAEYSKALRRIFVGRVPGLADLVTYWFEKARGQMVQGQLSAAGLVATNSIRDGFAAEVLKRVNDETAIFEAWSDEAWINDGAAVRVSLVAFSPYVAARRLNGVVVEGITPGLTATNSKELVDVRTARPIAGNLAVAFQGTTRAGPFEVPGSLARRWLSSPNPNGRSNADVVRPWSNGLDVTRRPSDTWIIDFGTRMSESEAALYELPFEHARLHVKPTRKNNRNPKLVEQWWHYDGVRVGMRKATASLMRFAATVITAKHRIFVWMHPTLLPDATLTVFARSDDATFGILQSRIHEVWSVHCGSKLEDRLRYLPGAVFETFAFPPGLGPEDTANQAIETLPDGCVIPASLGPRARESATLIAKAAKNLNDLRENWLHPPEWTTRIPEVTPLGMTSSPYPDRIIAKPGHEKDLAARTLTNLYNLRPHWLDAAHERLEISVAAAYGWVDYSIACSDEKILKSLLNLNSERSLGTT